MTKQYAVTADHPDTGEMILLGPYRSVRRAREVAQQLRDRDYTAEVIPLSRLADLTE